MVSYLRLVVNNDKPQDSQRIRGYTELNIIAVPEKKDILFYLQMAELGREADYPGELFSRINRETDSPIFMNLHGVRYGVNPEQAYNLPERFTNILPNIELVHGPLICHETSLLLSYTQHNLSLLYTSPITLPDPLYYKGCVMTAEQALNK